MKNLRKVFSILVKSYPHAKIDIENQKVYWATLKKSSFCDLV